MTQEDKELLLRDLCTRLPFNNHLVEYKGEEYNVLGIAHGRLILCKPFMSYTLNEHPLVEEVKPYLFPLSSMTDEQKKELLELTGYEARCEESCGFDSWGFYVNIVGEYKYEDGEESIVFYPDDIGIDWLNKNHFDYRGLIEKGLAIDATGLNIY